MSIIEQIKVEIERLKSNMDDRDPLAPNQKAGYLFALADVLSFISTLESEKPIQEGLEEEISKKYANDTTTMRTREQYAELAYHFYELGQQSKPKMRFPHEKDIVDKVFGAGNLDGWEYDEAKALVALAKEELLKDIKPKASEELDEEIERYLHSLGVSYGGWIDGMDDNDLRGIARHFAQWGSGTLKEVEL